MAPLCPPMRTHWRHLVDTIELVLPSAHQNVQPKLKIDQFCRFFAQLTAETPYTLQWAPLSANIVPSHVGIWTSNHWASPSQQPKWQHHRFSHFCTDDRGVSLYFIIGPPLPPQNCPLPWGCCTHLTHSSLGPPESSTQTSSRLAEPFLQGALV